MNFFIMVSLFLSAALGVFRGIDLALLTDAETGLCIVGPVWLRCPFDTGVCSGGRSADRR